MVTFAWARPRVRARIVVRRTTRANTRVTTITRSAQNVRVAYSNTTAASMGILRGYGRQAGSRARRAPRAPVLTGEHTFGMVGA